MHALDYLTVGVYLVMILSVGIFFGRNQTRSEFFVASRSMGWLTVGLSVMATLFSSNSFVFYPSAAFGDSLRIGLSLVAFLLMTPVVIWVFIPVYARLKVETAYEYLERRFHLCVRLLASGLFILLRIGWMASATYAASVVVSHVSGFSQISVIVGLGMAAIGYTMVGGLRAVMWTDVVQFFVFSATILVTLALIVSHADGEVGSLFRTYFDGRTGLVVDFSPSLTQSYGSWAILTGVFLEALSAFGVDQVAVQRYISAKSERTSQWGAAINLAAMWIVIPGLLLIGVGLYGHFAAHPAELVADALAGDNSGSDRALPQFVRLHFPPGLAGLFLAALMAAIMSSIDSGIHSVTTAIVVDFRDRLFPAAVRDNRTELRNIRIIVLLIGITSITLACLVDPKSEVFDVSKKLTAAFGAPLLAIFVLAFFSRRVTWQAVTLSAVGATLLTLYLMYTKDWFSAWYWPIGFGVALVAGYLLSLLQKPQPTDFTFLQIVRARPRVEATNTEKS